MQTFTDQYTISDGNETIELYHVDGLNHSDNMLVAYLPKEKILINADLYTPPAQGKRRLRPMLARMPLRSSGTSSG